MNMNKFHKTFLDHRSSIKLLARPLAKPLDRTKFTMVFSNNNKVIFFSENSIFNAYFN